VLVAPRVPEAISEEVHGAALPGGAEDLRERGFEARVGVGDRELHPDQAAGDQAPQELTPEGFGLALATSRPMISRWPVSCTACATTTHLRTTRPPSRTFSTFASTNA